MVKTLTIRDDVYERLAAIKGKDESFSELFERLAKRRGPVDRLLNLMPFRSPWKTQSFPAESNPAWRREARWSGGWTP